MRDLILAYITANAVTGFTVSSELPWDKDGAPLYLANAKRIYVDLAQTTQDPLIDTLDATGVSQETTTVTAYVVTDAKQLPTGYETLVSTLRAGRLASTIAGYTQRATNVSTSFEADRLITEFEFNFTKLIDNSQ